jgi:hypothetical protein
METTPSRFSPAPKILGVDLLTAGYQLGGAGEVFHLLGK